MNITREARVKPPRFSLSLSLSLYLYINIYASCCCCFFPALRWTASITARQAKGAVHQLANTCVAFVRHDYEFSDRIRLSIANSRPTKE